VVKFQIGWYRWDVFNKGRFKNYTIIIFKKKKSRSWDASSVNDFFILEELIEENDWALKELIEMMLLVDPTKRITAKKALNHHLFRELWFLELKNSKIKFINSN
jgi:serine/threonine protein kinase